MTNEEQVFNKVKRFTVDASDPKNAELFRNAVSLRQETNMSLDNTIKAEKLVQVVEDAVNPEYRKAIIAKINRINDPKRKREVIKMYFTDWLNYAQQKPVTV